METIEFLNELKNFKKVGHSIKFENDVYEYKGHFYLIYYKHSTPERYYIEVEQKNIEFGELTFFQKYEYFKDKYGFSIITDLTDENLKIIKQEYEKEINDWNLVDYIDDNAFITKSLELIQKIEAA